MLISSVNSTSHYSESFPSSAISQPSITSASSFEQLLSQQLSTSEVAKPLSRSASGNGSGVNEGMATANSSATRIAAWQSVNEAYEMRTLAGSIFASRSFGVDAGNMSELLAVQDLSDNFTNEDLSVSSGISAGIEASADLDSSYFVIHEFTVETTSDAASFNSTVHDIVLDAEQPVSGREATSTVPNATGGTIQESKQPQAEDAELIPLTSSSSTAISTPEVPLTEELAKVVATQVEQESSSEVTTVRIQLDRQDLGSVSLFLSINNNVVKVRIVAQSDLARQLIESQMDDLRQSLAENGVECNEFLIECDAAELEAMAVKRRSQPLVSVGFNTPSRKSSLKKDLPKPDFVIEQLNFIA